MKQKHVKPLKIQKRNNELMENKHATQWKTCKKNMKIVKSWKLQEKMKYLFYKKNVKQWTTCKNKHEKDLERMRQQTHAMVIPSANQPSMNAHTHVPNQPSSEPEVEMTTRATIQPPVNAHTHTFSQPSCEPNINIYCFMCHNGKTTDMNIFGTNKKQNIASKTYTARNARKHINLENGSGDLIRRTTR